MNKGGGGLFLFPRPSLFCLFFPSHTHTHKQTTRSMLCSGRSEASLWVVWPRRMFMIWTDLIRVACLRELRMIYKSCLGQGIGNQKEIEPRLQVCDSCATSVARSVRLTFLFSFTTLALASFQAFSELVSASLVRIRIVIIIFYTRLEMLWCQAKGISSSVGRLLCQWWRSDDGVKMLTLSGPKPFFGWTHLPRLQCKNVDYV